MVEAIPLVSAIPRVGDGDVVVDDVIEPGTREDRNARFAPHLTRLVISWMSEEPGRRARVVDGTLVFIDISGFTKLSERLARAGNVGAEELAATIGSTFTELLAVAYANGGRLLKFGGDALLLLFDGDQHAARACLSAIGMRRSLRDQGELSVLEQRVRLRMSVGVHTGQFHFFLVGGSHRELVATGPGISEIAALEAAADAGQILVSAATAGAIRASNVGPAKGPGFLLRRAPRLSRETDASSPVLVISPNVDLARCIPLGLRPSILAGSAPEHRRVTIAFVHFDGTDDLVRASALDEVAGHLDQLVTTVQSAADRQDVTFLASDVDRDGGKLILAAGAPSSSGDDERRMLLALREIIETPLAIPVRIGVNRGSVFAGDIGPPYRRTYTVMGDAVNLSARVMAKAAPGEILATYDVLDRSPTAFDLEAVEPFFVKGKTRPVEAWRVGTVLGAKSDPTTIDLPFTGRQAELSTLTGARDDATGGSGRLVEIVGPPGIGKSRLVDELRTCTQGMRELSIRCELYEATTPYFPVRGIVRGLLGLDPTRRETSDGDRLREAVHAVDPGLVGWAPLIAVVTDTPMVDTPETEQLEEQFRAARLGAVMREVLTHVLDGPTMLAVEDAQWIDDASAELLQSVTADIGSVPWLALVTRRDGGTAPWSARPDVLRLDLGPLSVRDASDLAREATHDAAISAHDIELLAERSTGNPLFLTELISAARVPGGLAALPDSVEALVAASIDRLPPQDRELLRRLAVLGRSFDAELIPAVLDAATHSDPAAWNRVEEYLVREPSGNWAFEHVVVRDCAYEGLAYRARRELHSRVGDAIRDRAGALGDQEPAALLSLHYLRAERFPEAFRYSRRAANRAQEGFADQEAAELYERALDAAQRVPDVNPTELAELREVLGDVHHRAGNFAEADVAFRSARRYVGGDPVAQARLQLKSARVKGWLDRYSEALRAITRGLRLLDGMEDPEARRQRARLLAWYGQFCEQGGSHRRAITWCDRAIDAAQDAADVEALAHALKILGWAQMELGDLETTATFYRSLDLYEELGDLPGQASVLNMLGGLAYWRGEWDEALDRYGQARDFAERSGNTVLGAFCTTNIGEIALDRGEFDVATALFQDAARVWRVAGDRPGTAFAKLLLGRAMSGFGRRDEALQLLAEARDQGMAVGAQIDALEAGARIAECRLASREYEDALRLVDEAIDQAHALGGVAAPMPLLLRVRGLTLLALGRIEEARAALDESLAAARSRSGEYEIGLTSLALARATTDLTEQEHLRAEGRTILDRLGVRAVPEVIGDPGGPPR